MTHEVFLTADAVRDLEEIGEYISVLGKIERALERLAELPRRGLHPRELIELGIREYREVFFKPYRIVYRVEAERFYVYLIADGRRDMQTQLERRLLGA